MSADWYWLSIYTIGIHQLPRVDRGMVVLRNHYRAACTEISEQHLQDGELEVNMTIGLSAVNISLMPAAAPSEP